MKLKKLAAAGMAGVLLMVGLAGCTPASTPSESGNETKVPMTLTWGIVGDLTSWSVNDSEFGNRSVLFQAVYDGLLMANPDGSVAPGIATEWSYDDSLTVLTMKIQEGLTFTDGTVLDAQAVADNLNRFTSGASPDASNLSSLKEAVAVDATTVQLNLHDVDPALLAYLARNGGLIQSPATFGTATEDTAPVGSGPYTYDAARSVAGSEYYFEANPDYRNADAVPYSSLVVKVIEDGTAMVNALKAGQVDVANVLQSNSFPELEAAGLKKLAIYLDWAGFSFVDRSGAQGSPFSDVRVRQAINYGIDREAMLIGIQNGLGEVRQQVFNENSLGYDESLNSYYEYDVEKAKALLAEAGYPNGFTVTLPSVAAALGEAPYALMAAELANIGITVEHEEVPLTDFFGDILTPKYPAYYMILERSANDWQFLNFLISDVAAWNPEKYTDEIAADLIAQIRVASDADRAPLLQQLNRHIVEQAWFAPFYAVQGGFFHKAEVNVVSQAGNAIPYLFNVTPAN